MRPVRLLKRIVLGVLAGLVALIGLAVVVGQLNKKSITVPGCTAQHWVGTWAADPSDALDPGLVDQTIRLVVTPHLGGQVLRIHVSNLLSAKPVSIAPGGGRRRPGRPRGRRGLQPSGDLRRPGEPDDGRRRRRRQRPGQPDLHGRFRNSPSACTSPGRPARRPSTSTASRLHTRRRRAPATTRPTSRAGRSSSRRPSATTSTGSTSRRSGRSARSWRSGIRSPTVRGARRISTIATRTRSPAA